jgi:hypothetical protein
MKAKPSCLGQRFGQLVVIELGSPIKDGKGRPRAGWLLECDCGNVINRRRNDFDRKPPNAGIKSCGCLRKAINFPRHTKADCTGQVFGCLTVLGRGDKVVRPDGKTRWLWRLQCACGKVIDRSREDLKKMKSCGCKKIGRGQHPNDSVCLDLRNQRFGLLTVMELLPERRQKKADWRCLCDCGEYVAKTSQQLRTGHRLNCGADKHIPGAVYPETPETLPGIAWETVQRFLPLTEHEDPAVRDRRVDRLIRISWILWYREYEMGEYMTDLYVKRYVRKSLAFAPVDVFWERKIEAHGGEIIDQSGKARKKKSGYNRVNKEIGSDVTNLTLPKYPVEKTLGKNILPKKRCYGVKIC